MRSRHVVHGRGDVAPEGRIVDGRLGEDVSRILRRRDELDKHGASRHELAHFEVAPLRSPRL